MAVDGEAAAEGGGHGGACGRLRARDFVTRIDGVRVEQLTVQDVIKGLSTATNLEVEVARACSFSATQPGVWQVGPLQATDAAGACARMGAGAGDEAPADDEWLFDGHAYVGKRVKRHFAGGAVVGKIVKWLPEDKSEPALFRVSHEDGDEEDLEAHEVQRCLIDPVGKVI